jgi:hypothetical protein
MPNFNNPNQETAAVAAMLGGIPGPPMGAHPAMMMSNAMGGGLPGPPGGMQGMMPGMDPSIGPLYPTAAAAQAALQAAQQARGIQGPRPPPGPPPGGFCCLQVFGPRFACFPGLVNFSSFFFLQIEDLKQMEG